MRKIFFAIFVIFLNQLSFAGEYGPIYGMVLTQRDSYISVLIKKSYKNCRGVRIFGIPSDFKKLDLKGKFISFRINSEICNDNSKIVSIKIVGCSNSFSSEMINCLKTGRGMR